MKTRDRQQYLSLKSATQKTCREAYSNYLINTLTIDPTGDKQHCTLINSKQHDHLGVAPLKEGNVIYCDTMQKANILNRQSTSVFIDSTMTSLPNLGPSSYTSLEDATVSCKGVVKVLQNLKPHKAAGPDDVSMMLLEEAAEESSLTITLLFQASLNQGTLLGNTPTWSKALVVQIFKKCSMSYARNNLQISLTSVLCKLREYILHSTILIHLAIHKILSDAQHGFRKRRSCDIQLLLALNDFARGMKDKTQTDILFLDFSKALDKVSRSEWKLPLRGRITCRHCR